MAGYAETARSLAPTLREYLQGLNILNDHVTAKYPALKLPLLQIESEKESLLVTCRTKRTTGIQHAMKGLIKVIALKLHRARVVVTEINKDIGYCSGFTLSVKVKDGTIPASSITATINQNVKILDSEPKINPSTFCQLFPFHIVFNSSLKIVQAGIAVVRVVKEIENQMLSFRDIFQFVSPDIDCTYDEIRAHAQSLFVTRVKDRIRLSPRRSIGDNSANSPIAQSPLLGTRRLDSNSDEHKKHMRLKVRICTWNSCS